MEEALSEDRTDIARVACDGTSQSVIAPSSLEECPVCFESMGGDCPYRKLSCGHSYHYNCIARWLQRNASCPLCKAETPMAAGQHESTAFRIDMGHQEMCRVVQDIEDIFLAVHQCVGPEYPVAISGIAYNLCVSLGYEDEDELEEALGGPLADFLAALPHFEVVWPEQRTLANTNADGEEVDATEVRAPEPKAMMKPDMGADGTEIPKRITFTVSEREDLWRVVLQGPRAMIEIPEIEFAIRPDSKRRIDTIYNLIAAAVYNLGDHVRLNSKERGGAMDDEDSVKICDAIDSLNRLLDLEQTFTIVLSDAQGISDLKPIDGAHVETLVVIDDDSSGVAARDEPAVINQ